MQKFRIKQLVVGVCLIVISFIAWSPCKNTLVFMTALLAIGVPMVLLRPQTFSGYFAFIVVLWIASAFLPADIILKRANKLSISFVRAYTVHGTQSRVDDEARVKGLVETKDYVLIDCSYSLIPPKFVLMITF
jgi:hypothetical protein